MNGQITQHSTMLSKPRASKTASSVSLPWWGRLGISLVSFAISLLLLELGVRLFIPQNLDFFNWQKIKRPATKPSMYYEYIPYARNDLYIGVPVTINSLGLRDYEIQIPKPPHTVRILALGDSITFGYGVRLEETYLKVLKRKLNQHAHNGIRYEVINAGVEATGLDYYYHFLRSTAPLLEPDLILIGIALHDISQYKNVEGWPHKTKSVLSSSCIDGAKGLRLTRRLSAQLLLHSHVYLASYMNLKSLLYKIGVLDINRVHSYDFLPLKPPSAKQAKAWESSLKLLSKIVALVRERDYPLLLVVFPMEVQLSPAAIELYRRELRVSIPPEALKGDPQRRIRAFGVEQGIPVVDLLPAFQSANHHELFLRNRAITYDPVHPSPFGHQLAGDEVYRILTANGFLLPPSRTAARIKEERE